MQETLLQILSIAYAATGVVAITGYYSTIKDLYYKIPSANIMSYIFWASGWLIAVIYGIFILPDFLFITVSSIHLLSCTSIIVLRIRIKEDS